MNGLTFPEVSFWVSVTALLLTIVALIVTVVGFFASLRFYRDGMETQSTIRGLLEHVRSTVKNVDSQLGGVTRPLVEALTRPPGDLSRAQSRTAEEVTDREYKLNTDYDRSAQGARGDQPTAVGRADDQDIPTQLFSREVEAAESPGADVIKLFSLLGLRFTNVTDEVGRFFFLMGVDQNFNLFDGQRQAVYYGHFYKLNGADIVGRIRVLIGRLYDTRLKVAGLPEDPRRDLLLSLLNDVRVTVLIPSTVTAEAINRKLQEYQPDDRPVHVEAWTAQDLKERLRKEYRRMDPER